MATFDKVFGEDAEFLDVGEEWLGCDDDWNIV